MKLPRFYLAICALLIAFWTYELSSFSLNQALPFDADEAHHAARGLDVYDALREGSPSRLFAAIRDQSFYPPLHSLTVAASYTALDGPSLAASRLPSWITFLLSIFVTALAIRMAILKQVKTAPQHFVAYGAGIASVLAFFSPLSLQNAGVCMIEPLSMLVTAAVLYVFARYEHQVIASRRIALAFGLIFGLAILTKYTMLIFVVAPGLLALWGIPILTPKLAHKAAAIATAMALGCFAAWLAVSHWEGVWYFLVGFPKRGIAFSLPALLTQPEMYLYRCALHPAIAIAALALAAFALAQVREQRVVLFAVLCICVTLAVLGVSKQQGGRFMIHALPCLWLLCGIGAARLAANWRAGGTILWVLLLSVCLIAPKQRERLQSDILRALETKPAARDMIALVLKNADPKHPVLQIGSNDLFNVESVRWSLAASSGISFRDITVDQFPMDYERLEKLRYAQPWREPYDKYRKQIQASLQQVLSDGGYKTLVIFEGERWLRKPQNKLQVNSLLATHPHEKWTDGTYSLTVLRF